MNERIRELAEQAGITTNLDTDYFEKDINKWVDYYSEKFAELIVQECIEAVKNTPKHCAYTTFQEQIVDCTISKSVEQLTSVFQATNEV